MSTHVLGEIEGTCDRLLVINRGKLIADDPVSTISRRVRSSKSVIVEVQGRSVEKSLKKLKDITDLEREDGIGDRKKFLLTFDGENDPRPDIFRMAKDQNWVLWELRESELKLQDVFQALTAQDPNLETDDDNQTSPEIDRLN